MVAVAHHWKPIEPPVSAEALASPDLPGFTQLWLKQREKLRASGADERFLERMRRWWAIETGIIERIYDVSLGATRLLVEQGFDASLVAHGEATMEPLRLMAVLQDHREALDFAMDVIGGSRPLSTSWIKELHALLTRHQETATGRTPDGRVVEIPLLRGQYKLRPNSPLSREEGGVHEYCPPEQVAPEMERLLQIHSEIPQEYPDVRSAWLHHAFTQIHPFQDGNGRVARVLASLDFIHSGLFPLLIRRDEKGRYLDALRAADEGSLTPLVHLFGDVQQQMLIKAISEAEAAVSALQTTDAIFAAAEAKLRGRVQMQKSDRNRLTDRMHELLGRATRLMEEQASRARRLPNIRATVNTSKDGTHHYYRQQIIEIGIRNDYWVDTAEPRRWVRLELRNGGQTDLVIVLHFVGNPSPGAAVAVAFVTHRDKGERVGDQPHHEVVADPLLLTAQEDPLRQQRRFETWLEGVIPQGLAIWTKYL